MSNYPPSYSAAGAPQTNTMAIVSLVFGILGLVGMCPGVGSIVAVITGNMAQREISAEPGRYTGDGLARAGVILGWVGIALMVIGVCLAIAYFIFVAFIIGTQDFESFWRLLPQVAGPVLAALA